LPRLRCSASAGTGPISNWAATRYYRITHQPLTRRWRLHISNTAFTGSGTGLALGQTYEQLEDAIAAIQRISAGRFWSPAARLDFRRLRATALSRRSVVPAQTTDWGTGALGWNLQLSRTQALEAAP
jgi:hypothetical protein